MPSMLLFENFLDPASLSEPPFCCDPVSGGQVLPLGIQDTCAACELHVAMRPEVNKAEGGFPAAGSFSAQQVARMPSMGQDSSCADIDSTHNQNLERTGTNILHPGMLCDCFMVGSPHGCPTSCLRVQRKFCGGP